MNFAPRHDYDLFEQAVSEARPRRVKSASPEANFHRYSEILALTLRARKASIKLGDARRQWFKEKREQRMNLLAVLKHLDQKRG